MQGIANSRNIMENQQLFLASPTHLLGSISLDHMNYDCNFSLIVPSYGHDFDEFMFPDSAFADNVLFSAREEEVVCAELKGTVAGTPDLNLSVDGNDPGSGGAEEGNGENHGDGDSSGMAMTRMMKPRRDRAKTLVSERRRRGGMKEKLYELRSLVPNITKMDKASIISDAVVYVRNLQGQAKEMEEEIAVLESSSGEGQVLRVPLEKIAARVEERNNNPCIEGRIVLQVMAYEVAKGRFYVKVECNKGDGVASSIYAAIESLESFNLESSNFSMVSERYVLTLVFDVRGFGEETRAPTVKLWVMAALLKEGFELKTPMIT